MQYQTIRNRLLEHVGSATLLSEPIRQNASQLLNAWKSEARALLIWLLVCLSVAVFYTLTTPPEFTSSSLVILEPRRPFSGSQLPDTGVMQLNLDNSQIESQVQIVKSEQVLKFVFRELDLKSDPEFIGEPSRYRRFMNMIFPSSTPVQTDELKEAMAYPVFADHVSVRRIGQSQVLEISFTSRSGARAASIANSITAAFIRDQIEAKSLSMRRNGEWLQGRIDDIRVQQDASVEAVRKGVSPTIQFSASDARIISSANAPLSKSFPQTGLLLTLGFAFAMLTGLGTISIRQSLDRRIRNKRQINREFGLDCLGIIPLVKPGNIPGSYGEFLSYTVSEKGVNSEFSEGIRSVRTTLLSMDHGKKPYRIGFVSCFPDEGKTLIIANIAHLLAASNRKVTLLDMDMRRFSLTKHLVNKSVNGLSAVLQNNLLLSLLARVQIRPSLTFVPAINTSEQVSPNLFVDAKIIRDVFNQFQDYDYILCDLPAIQTSSDAYGVGKILDAIVLVIEADSSSKNEVAEIIESFRQINVKILGVILNKTKDNSQVSVAAT